MIDAWAIYPASPGYLALESRLYALILKVCRYVTNVRARL